MQVDLPDERLAGAVRAALAQVLLEAQSARPGGDAVAALEDWGFDAEAAETKPSQQWSSGSTQYLALGRDNVRHKYLDRYLAGTIP